MRKLVPLFCMLAGCATYGYAYVPTEHATATVAGRPAARYDVPPEKPAGEVEIASFGMTELQTQPDARPTRVLHVRMVVANHIDEKAWTLDTRNQYAVIAGEGRSRPVFVNADVGDAPTVSIGRGQQRIVDLYYPVPEGFQAEERIPQFDFAWEVQTSPRLVAKNTSFERLLAEPQYSYGPSYGYSVVLGWGPYWWYDPLWPAVTFWHRPVIVYRYGPRFVRVARPVSVARPVRVR